MEYKTLAGVIVASGFLNFYLVELIGGKIQASSRPLVKKPLLEKRRNQAAKKPSSQAQLKPYLFIFKKTLSGWQTIPPHKCHCDKQLYQLFNTSF